jgi:hypothetical protein
MVAVIFTDAACGGRLGGGGFGGSGSSGGFGGGYSGAPSTSYGSPGFGGGYSGGYDGGQVQYETKILKLGILTGVISNYENTALWR